MKFKSIPVITVLLLVVASLLVSGCTNTSTNSPSATSTSSPSATSTDFTNQINTAYKNAGTNKTILVTPFTYKLVNGMPTYTGVVKDGTSDLYPRQHNMTYILTGDRKEARSVFAQEINKSKALGYKGLSEPSNTSSIYFGYPSGTIANYTEIGNKEFKVELCSPNFTCLYGLVTVNFGDYFPVFVDYNIRVED